MPTDLIVALVGDDVGAACFFHPGSRDQLAAVPLALLQIEQAELCKFFHIQLQAACTEGVAQRVILTHRALDAQRGEQAWHQIIHEGLPRLALDQDAQQIRACVVVLEYTARFMGDIGVKHKLHPVFFHHFGPHCTHQHGAFKAHRHRDEVAQLHLFRFSEGCSGASAAKWSSTKSSSVNRPS